MKKIIFGFVGGLSSGKGTAAKYIAEKKETNVYRFSTILRDILDRLHYEISRENMQKLSTALRSNLSEDILAKVIAKDVKKDSNKTVVVEGIRRWADIKYLIEMEGFVLIRIVANPKLRYERLVARAENAGDENKTYDQFLTDEKKEADAEIPKIMEKATEEINNDGDFETFYHQLDSLIAKYE